MRKFHLLECFTLLGLLALSLAKFWQLDQGLAYFEPDPYPQAQIAMRLAQGHLSLADFGADGLFKALWVLIWAATLHVCPDAFVAGRVISAVSALVITVVLYFYGRRRFSRFTGLAMAFLFTAMPLSVFFARYPLGDMLLALWSLLFVVFFDSALQDAKPIQAIIAGLFLALAIATKFSAIQLGMVGALFLLIPLPRFDLRQWREQIRSSVRLIKSTHTFPLQFIPLLSLVVAGGILFAGAVPFLLSAARQDPLGTARILLSVPYAFVRTSVAGDLIPNTLTQLGWLPYWLSAPACIALMLGVIGGPRMWGSQTYVLLIFLVSSILALVSNVSQARYWVPVLPLLAVAAGWGVTILAHWIRTRTAWLGGLGIQIGLLILLAVTMTPPALHAFQSTFKAQWLDQTHQVIQRANLPNGTWVFSSYWPNIIADYASIGLDGTWLTTDLNDARAFAPYWHSEHRAGIQDTPLNILTNAGGVVVIEEKYSRQILSTSGRRQAIDYVQAQYVPVLSIEDPNPNFPYSPQGNRVWVYIIPPR